MRPLVTHLNSIVIPCKNVHLYYFDCVFWPLIPIEIHWIFLSRNKLIWDPLLLIQVQAKKCIFSFYFNCIFYNLILFIFFWDIFARFIYNLSFRVGQRGVGLNFFVIFGRAIFSFWGYNVFTKSEWKQNVLFFCFF